MTHPQAQSQFVYAPLAVLDDSQHLSIRDVHILSRGESLDSHDGDDVATQRAWIELNLSALRHNISALQQRLAAGTELWGVVKANAYGHGAIAIARAAIAAGVRGLCVATLAEGMELRQAGIDCPILILGALWTTAEVTAAVSHQLDITITAATQLPLCQQVADAVGSQVAVHLNVDTGMARLGIEPTEALSVWQAMVQMPQLLSRSVYSHFATADEMGHSATEAQFKRFETWLADIRRNGLPLPTIHMANSAATLADRRWHYQMVRVGLGLYGMAPAQHLAGVCDLRPVMAVKARVVHLQTVSAGTGVSYGHRYVTSTDTRLATVGIGYADGVPRCLSGCLRGQIHGIDIHQVGTVTMDQTIWDVTAVEAIAIGDVVDLFIPGQGAKEWAEQLGTIPYEIVCGFSERLPRRVV